jgi:hypothetical protein
MASPVAGSTATDMAITATKNLRIKTIPIGLPDRIVDHHIKSVSSEEPRKRGNI